MKFMNLGFETVDLNGVDSMDLRPDPATDSLADTPMSPVAEKALTGALNDTQSLGRVNDVLESNSDDIADMAESSQEMIRVATESIRGRLLGGAKGSSYAVESITSVSSLKLAIEDNKNIIERAWDAIVKFFKGIYEWIKGLFISKKNTPQKIEAKVQEVLAVTQKAKAAPEPEPSKPLPTTGETIVFESNKYNRITGGKNTTLDLVNIDVKGVSFAIDVVSKLKGSNLDIGKLNDLTDYLVKNNKNIARDFNNDKRSTDGQLNLSFEYNDSHLGRSIEVSQLGLVRINNPEPINVEYTVHVINQRQITAVESAIKKLGNDLKGKAELMNKNIDTCVRELDKVNKVLDSMKDRNLDKDKVNEMVSSTKAILSINSKLYLEFEKDFTLNFDLYKTALGVVAFVDRSK